MKMRTKKKIAAALILVLLLTSAFGSTIAKIAEEVTFYWFDHTETELQVKAFAEENGVFFADYPDSLIQLLERNPETEKFVLEYPLYRPAAYDLAEYKNAETVPLFLQWDQRWGYETYGSDMMAITGCGPTCLAMVGYYVTGEERFDPAAVAAFAEESGYYVEGSGSSWTLISEGGPQLGLDVVELPLDENRMKGALENGNPIILAMGPGDFTSSGHYIVLTGVQDGMFVVNDPNSPERSGKLWSYEEISGQIRNIWAISGRDYAVMPIEE